MFECVIFLALPLDIRAGELVRISLRPRLSGRGGRANKESCYDTHREKCIENHVPNTAPFPRAPILSVLGSTTEQPIILKQAARRRTVTSL